MWEAQFMEWWLKKRNARPVTGGVFWIANIVVTDGIEQNIDLNVT
jgi:P2-related tail formation protein